MNREEFARQLHSQGYNCAQCVLLSAEDYTGLDREIAVSISCGFGGGVRSGEICGCISGGVMALGSRSTKTEAAELAKEMVAAFREEFGCVRCSELQQKFGGKSNCDNMIAFSAALTAKILEQHDKHPHGQK